MNLTNSEIKFLRAELSAKNKIIEESLVLPESMLRDELLFSYKSASGKTSAKDL